MPLSLSVADGRHRQALILANKMQLLQLRSAGTCPEVPPTPGGMRERERERESFIRNNLHNGVVSGAARGQALRGPMKRRTVWVVSVALFY